MVRNNAASLLSQLLGEEKNVSKILIVKGSSDDLRSLIKTISLTAADGEKRLEDLARLDPTLDLRRFDLPAGEKAAREAESKTEEHQLLFSSGANFAFNLLMTQAQALGYGSHLAATAAKNSPSPEQAAQIRLLGAALEQLQKRVTGMIRALPSA